MNVKLLSYTPNALNLLLKTKGTRLGQESTELSTEEKMEHLAYMRDTIKSSWEFVDYVFEITNVPRSFTHQLVRTRTGAYAQQSQRTVGIEDFSVTKPYSIQMNRDQEELWNLAVSVSRECYDRLILRGVAIQDARGIVPTNVETNIISKFSLRTLHDMALLRLCTRTQGNSEGDYQNVFRAMRQEVINVHPWAEDFLQPQCVQTGTCAFPRYGKKECPAWHEGLDRTAAKEESRKKFWSIRYAANPVAAKGFAQ